MREEHNASVQAQQHVVGRLPQRALLTALVAALVLSLRALLDLGRRALSIGSAMVFPRSLSRSGLFRRWRSCRSRGVKAVLRLRPTGVGRLCSGVPECSDGVRSFGGVAECSDGVWSSWKLNDA